MKLLLAVFASLVIVVVAMAYVDHLDDSKFTAWFDGALQEVHAVGFEAGKAEGLNDCLGYAYQTLSHQAAKQGY